MSKRYERNMKTLSQEENDRLKEFKVFVAGCGGLGGYIIEELGRLGIGYISAVDGDVFEESNLNRQILSTVPLLGRSKAEIAKIRMVEVNPDICLNAINTMIDEDNCRELIAGHNLVMDALDNVTTRKILERSCEEVGLPLVHGAIAGWYGQVSTIFPGDRIIHKVYPDTQVKGAEAELGNPSFTPAIVASIQVVEAVKVLFNKGTLLRNKLLTINLLNHEYEIFTL